MLTVHTDTWLLSYHVSLAVTDWTSNQYVDQPTRQSASQNVGKLEQSCTYHYCFAQFLHQTCLRHCHLQFLLHLSSLSWCNSIWTRKQYYFFKSMVNHCWYRKRSSWFHYNNKFVINFSLFWIDFPELLSCLCFTQQGLPFVFEPKNPHHRLTKILH